VAGLSAQGRRPENARALSGYVLTSEWLPVSSGSVSAKSPGSERIASIASTGRFRIEALAPGMYDVSVSAPRLMTHLLKVTMPPSGRLMLPPIQLSTGSYLRFRFFAPGGAAIDWPRVIRTSFDVNGVRIPETSGGSGRNEVDPEGATVIGPLPPGMSVLAVDTPPYARMRLRDVRVTGESPLVDAGKVILQPGAALKVTVVDAARVPVVNHAVLLDDGMALSPLWWAPVRTDTNGDATFDRLASGRYYLRTAGLAPCGGVYPPLIVRPIDAPPRGAIATKLVIGGRARLRLTTGGAPFAGKFVTLTPDAPSPVVPAWLRPSPLLALRQRSLGRIDQADCFGTTDADGRVELPNVPPGPARVAVRVGNSTWVRRLELAADEREVVLEVPSGLLPVRIIDAGSGRPVSGAVVTWTSAGAQVEATASATGDALLEGVSYRPGTLAIEAQNYRRRELKLAAPPDVLDEVTLEGLESLELRCRVVTDAGAPLAGAVVELAPHDVLEVPHVATTDGEGIARFSVASPGPVRLVVRAGRYVASTVQSIAVPLPSDDPVPVTLSRGYRIVATVDAAAGAGAHAIRVMNATGVAMDALLDAASERTIHPGRRVSLGPLPPGSYIVELRGGSAERTLRVTIGDGDVSVTFRE
jgi:hypothetical protein